MNPHFFLTIVVSTVVSIAGERAQLLKTVVKGADKLEITETQFFEEDPGVTFTFSKPNEIAKLIQSLEFEKESPGYCACRGDCKIIFYRGNQELTSLSYHHGISLRWNSDKWEGDSLFTPDSRKIWREWFKKHGEPRFKDWHEAEVKAYEKQRSDAEAFISPFPPASRKIIEEYLAEASGQLPPLEDEDKSSPVAKKLAESFASIPELTLALTKALGSLGLRGSDLGAWSASTVREQLLLDSGNFITPQALLTVIESDDPATLLGTARLFFFEDFYQKLPREARGPATAKLVEAVILHDRAGNTPTAIRALGWFPCAEATLALERIALGEIKRPAEETSDRDEPSTRHAVCISLSKTTSNRFDECLKVVQKLKTENPADPLALLIARTLRGEKGLLEKDVFERDSYILGYGALTALENEHSTKALDLIITAGTTHSWAAIREESVLTIERMTGKKWFQNQKNERAEWHAKDIREWWNENKTTFKFPDKK